MHRSRCDIRRSCGRHINRLGRCGARRKREGSCPENESSRHRILHLCVVLSRTFRPNLQRTPQAMVRRVSRLQARVFLLLIGSPLAHDGQHIALLDVPATLLPNSRMRDFGPRPTLGELQRTTPWVWLWCEHCQHRAPLACAVAVILWGPEAIKRQTASRRTLHQLRRERCDPPASRLGRQSCRLLSVSRLKSPTRCATMTCPPQRYL
jgi:hypothetical protein